MLTKQEAFDKAALGVLTQGKPAFNTESRLCLYLAEDGCKCAVGHLLPEGPAQYHEGGVGPLLSAYPELERVLGDPVDVLSFLIEMQVAHDRLANVGGQAWRENFLIEMRALAKRWRLNPAVLDTPWPAEVPA